MVFAAAAYAKTVNITHAYLKTTVPTAKDIMY